MERICGNLTTSVDDARQRTRHCHVDLVSVAAACGVALLALVCVVYLRLARADSTKRPRLLRCHVFRCLVALLLLLALLLELADALLSTPTSWHVLATPATTLLSWASGAVLYYHVETRRRDGLLGLLVAGWTLCAASRVLRLAYLWTLRLDATSARPWTALGVATLFGVLALTDAYTLYMAACRRRSRKHEFPANAPGNVIYRHREASFYNKATFFWLTSLLRRGYANPLELEDLGVLPHEETTEQVFNKFKHIYDEEKHRAKLENRRCSLWRCYFRSVWPMFALGGVLKLLGDLVGLVGPLGISVIIEYVRTLRGEGRLDGDTDGGRNPGFPLLGDLLNNGYVMSVVVFLSCIAQGTFSQSSTHLVNVEGIHLKGSLQALVYSKALRLSVWSISDQKEEVEANGVLHKGRPTKTVEKSATSTDLGTITNLMSEDAFNVMSFFWIGHYVWAIPLKIGVLMYLLYLKLGLSAIIGAAFCILTMTPLQFLIGKKMSTNSKAIIEMSDERLKKINEVLQGVKLLKLYGWECVYGARIAQTRKKELVLLDRDSLYWALMTFLTQASSVMVTLVTFGVYFATVGPSLSAGDVFAGLALFNQLTVPLFIFPITVPIIISALVSTKRLEDFLSLPEASTPSADGVVAPPAPVKEDVAVQEVAYAQEAGAPKSRENSVFGLDDIQENEEEPDEDEDADVEGEEGEDQEDGEVTVSVKNGCFSWSGDNRVSLTTKNIVVSSGKLTLVVGKVGSGKTSFLSALLGEMFTTSGKVQWAPGVSVAYAAQRPWLLNASLRDNILFGQPYRPRRYNRVIRACALQPDIDILPGKDLTEIGEKGINLSGGQKQRVSIARALYTWATVVILDDPLSALDYQVAQQVFEDGIKKLLLRQRRTVILVTHSLQLLPHAHKIIALENGSVRVQGSLAEIETADPQLAQAWRAIMSREALEEQTRGRTARERWQLVKLVSRIGVQLKQRNVVDGSWQTEEEEHVTKPLFVPFRKRRGTFSGSRGSRYFSHDLPLPTDECEDEECLIRPKRMSLKRGRALTATCPLGVSALPQHKQVLRSSSLQTHDFLPYPVVRQLSSPAMQHHEQLITGPCRTRNFGVDNGVQAPFLKRILSIKSKRNTWAASDFPAPITREHSVLKRLLSSKPSAPTPAPVAASKPEQLRVKRLQSTGSTYSEDFNDDEEGYDDATDASAGRLVSEEEREYGKIPRRIYWVYLCACGVTAGLGYIVSTIVWQGLRVYTDYWLSEWADFTNSTSENDTGHALDEKETLNYFTTYAIMSVASIFLSLSSNGIGQYAGAQARRTLHDKMLLNLLRCPVRFFETTPVGRIINRFSTDMGVIDRKIATTIQRLLQFLLLCFSAIVVNAVVAPWFLLVAVPICIIYFVIQRFYRSSARELQRLDSITRSPIFSHFSETLGGLTTIRAFSHQRRFTAMLHHKMDSHTNVFLIINTGNRWLGIALDYLGGVIVFVAIVASLLSATFIPSITPALVGFAINYTLLVPIYLNWVVKFLADMEMYMGAVERVEQYALTPREDYREQGVTVQPRWPEKGDIVFSGVSLRYDVNREPVVSNFNLHIPAGQKVGICGRTGSGKSSLAMSLFNMIDVFEGNILIDGVDINQVPLQVLRSRLSIIPQDVIMFSGTVRSNLDPSSQYSDEKLWMSLELAQLKSIVAGYPGGLDGEVREGGENLSAGERQLFCLARAILHDAACLVMDEATSSVDPATEKALLAAATRAFASRTVITIAHRLSTILDCDRILVLDDGRIVEEGTPKQLLNRSMGIFSSMLRASEETTLALLPRDKARRYFIYRHLLYESVFAKMKMKIFCIPIGSSRGTFTLPPMENRPRTGSIKPHIPSITSSSTSSSSRNNNTKKLEKSPTIPEEPGGKVPPPPQVKPPPPPPVEPQPSPPDEPQPPPPDDPSNPGDREVFVPQEKRKGITAESTSRDAKVADDIKTRRFSKDSRSQKLIKEAILANEFLNNLDIDKVDAIVEAMYHKNMPDNSFIITEGEPGSHMYVSDVGLFEVSKEGQILGQFGPGTAFGELAILYNAKRMASIKVLKKAKVWVLDRREFQKIMMRKGLQKREENVNFLRSVPLLQKLNSDVLKKMSDLLRVEFYMAGTEIVTQGDHGDTFYIISGGTVKITKKQPDSNEEWEVGSLGRGEYFGELALLKQDRRQATVTALAPGVECLILDRVPFVQLLGDLPDLEKKEYTSSPRHSPSQVPQVKQEYDYISLEDLDYVGTLGVGGFGRVELRQYRKDKSLTFALKCLKKVHVVEQQQEEHAYNEKAVMLQCNACTFISKLYRTYRDNKYVYFLMEPCLGGDVFTVLQKHRFFDDRTARFMTACVVEALEYLHERGFIYRDLKPENLLLDSKGYIKMIDFGFAKSVGASGKTWTFAGTPEYVAPEIIQNKGHDRAVDYWALGVLMHEFLTGRPPFRGSDHMKTYNLIIKGIEAVQFPKYVQRSATHLIRRLCRAVATERLGYQKAGVKDIKAHKWFQGFDWLGLKNRTLKAPIIQSISGPTDISNFDKYKKNYEIPPDEFSGWDKDF